MGQTVRCLAPLEVGQLSRDRIFAVSATAAAAFIICASSEVRAQQPMHRRQPLKCGSPMAYRAELGWLS